MRESRFSNLKWQAQGTSAFLLLPMLLPMLYRIQPDYHIEIRNSIWTLGSLTFPISLFLQKIKDKVIKCLRGANTNHTSKTQFEQMPAGVWRQKQYTVCVTLLWTTNRWRLREHIHVYFYECSALLTLWDRQRQPWSRTQNACLSFCCPF